MKTIQSFLLLSTLVLAFALRAQTTDIVKFSGTVVDGQGNPVVDAVVDCYQFPSRMTMALPDLESKQHVMTDSKGAFAFSIPSGAATVIAKKGGFAPAWKTLQSVSSDQVERLVLTAPTVLAGVVIDEKDRPVADAEVSVLMALDKAETEWTTQPNFLFGKAASELFFARTGADGRFRIDNFPTGAQANLGVKKPGRALRVTAPAMNGLQLQAQAGQEDIKLVTDPAANIEGKVVLRDTGAPLAHARVQLQPVNGWGGFSTTSQNIESAADGSFRIPEVAAGSYRVTAIFTNQPMASWVAESVPVTVGAGETAHDVKIQAFKGGAVEVTVFSKGDQKVLPGVGVSAYSEGYQMSVVTGTNGVASFRLPPGQFTFFAMKEGLSQAQTQFTVTDGETGRVRLELNTPAKITGTLRDSAGAPVANASVGIFPNYGGGNNSEAKSDLKGHYEAPWQKPAWNGMENQRYYLVARNQDRNLAGMQEIEEKSSTVDLTLKPGMSISVSVQDVKGKAITNATGFIMLHTENMGFSLSGRPIPNDGPGRFRVDGLPAGQRYGMQVMAKGYGTGHEEMEAADPKADHYDFPPLVLKLADRKLAGRVLGTNGQPAVGVQVYLNGEGQPNGNALTDAQGRFAFDAVCEGAVSVNANSQGSYGSVDATGGDTNVVIRFNSNNRVYTQVGSLTLTGTVREPSGNPAVGARVTVTPAWGQVDTATTDSNGEYSVHWQAQQGMRGAKYFVIARDADRNLAGMEEIDEKKTHVSVRMESGFSISGTVQDANGAPLTRANINLNIMAGNNGGMVDHQPVKVGSDGTFTIPALPMGQQYNVYVSANGYGSGRKSITKKASQTNSVQLAPFKLKTADRQLAGQVLGMDDKPLSGVWVSIYGNNQPNGNVRSDATGHFKFKVCEGAISVNAYMQGPGRNNYGNANARGGDTDVVVKIGATPPRQRTMGRSTPLKPQPWTLAALISWPVDHKTGVIVLLSLQTALVLGTGGGVFWFTRRRKS